MRKMIIRIVLLFVMLSGISPLVEAAESEFVAAMVFEQELLEGGDLRRTIIDDFNGDGIFDVGAFNEDGTVSAYLANGDGTFAEETTYSEEDLALSSIAGEPDSAVVSAAESSLSSGSESAATAAAVPQSGSAGSVNCWGKLATPNAELSDMVAIAGGWRCSVALKSDGSIVGWGYDNYGQTTPPTGKDFVAIATGYAHSLALKSDGSIVGWGNDYYGQTTPPAGNAFVAIAACTYHSLAICGQIKRAEVLLLNLAQDVIELNLQNGIENSLDAKLDAALQALESINQNDNVAAINTLESFINAVEAQSGDKISTEDATALINAAQEIIDLLSAE